MLQKVDNFTNRLNKALLIRNTKQSIISAKTGISKSLISKYCNGHSEAGQVNVYLLAKALNVSET